MQRRHQRGPAAKIFQLYPKSFDGDQQFSEILLKIP